MRPEFRRLGLAVFRHGQSEPVPIVVSQEHPFWSADRTTWVPAWQLRPGERLIAEDGSTPRVWSVSARERPEPLYNLEVEGEHCCRVSHSFQRRISPEIIENMKLAKTVTIFPKSQTRFLRSKEAYVSTDRIHEPASIKVALEPLAQQVPTLVRVAAALAAIEHVLPTVKADDSVVKHVKHTLAFAWRWTAGAEVDPSEVYEFIDPLNQLAHKCKRKGRELSLIQAAGAAMYYVAWLAYSFEAIKRKEQRKLAIPDDMFEITEDTFIQCLDICAKTATDHSGERVWQQSLLNKLISDFHTEKPNETGKPISRSYFVKKGFLPSS